jgi:uncharacterized protein YbjQ (UPF0145 family)
MKPRQRMITVFRVRVITKDVISDTIARFKSIIGGRIKAYEKIIQESLEDCYAELLEDYPNIQNIKFGTSEMIKDGAELILYGEVTEKEYVECIKKKGSKQK